MFYVIVFNTITVMSLEIISKKYAETTFISGPVVKTITSSDGSVSVFTDGPNVDLKVKSGGGGENKFDSFSIFYFVDGDSSWLMDEPNLSDCLKNSIYGYNGATFPNTVRHPPYIDIVQLGPNDTWYDKFPGKGPGPITVYLNTPATLDEIYTVIYDGYITQPGTFLTIIAVTPGIARPTNSAFINGPAL